MDPGQRILRAFDLHTGKPVWQVGQSGAGDTDGGVLSTAGGVVFYGADDGSFAAVDAKDGTSLWHFQTNQSLHASPMTYEFDHKQYVAITAGSNVISFALPQQGVTPQSVSADTMRTSGVKSPDTGAIPDASWTATGSKLVQRISLPDGQQREIEVLEPLTSQLREAGFSPGDISYLALSHYHYDHTGNANIFAHATWLVREEERAPMFAAQAPGTTQPSSYAALKDARTIIIDAPDYDVFGDGTVVIKFAPGHTPGHQVLSLNLPNSGRIVLSGDLYHFPAERQLDRVPLIDTDAAQTRASRAAIESFIAQNHAQLWIQHDIHGFSALKKAPQYYD
jgi:glyoxylase-like metal-dependent hydrolase (beta-lactamase superfamily II)